MIVGRPSETMAGPIQRRFRMTLVLLTLAGLLSLILFPVETLISGAALPAPIWVMRLGILIQPAILLGIALMVGFALAPKLGLRAPAVAAFACGEQIWPILRHQLLPASLVAAVVAGILLMFHEMIVPQIAQLANPDSASLLKIGMPPVTRLLYGGIAEEVMTRWGLVSLFGWIIWRLAGKPDTIGIATLAMAVTLSALLFALGHVPLLYAIIGSPPLELLGAVIVGNALPGLMFGWLFVKYGLEAAMIGHMGAHALAMALGA